MMSWSRSLSAAAGAPGMPGPLPPPQPLFNLCGFAQPHPSVFSALACGSTNSTRLPEICIQSCVNARQLPPPALRSLRGRCLVFPAWFICSQHKRGPQALGCTLKSFLGFPSPLRKAQGLSLPALLPVRGTGGLLQGLCFRHPYHDTAHRLGFLGCVSAFSIETSP